MAQDASAVIGSGQQYFALRYALLLHKTKCFLYAVQLALVVWAALLLVAANRAKGPVASSTSSAQKQFAEWTQVRTYAMLAVVCFVLWFGSYFLNLVAMHLITRLCAKYQLGLRQQADLAWLLCLVEFVLLLTFFAMIGYSRENDLITMYCLYGVLALVSVLTHLTSLRTTRSVSPARHGAGIPWQSALMLMVIMAMPAFAQFLTHLAFAVIWLVLTALWILVNYYFFWQLDRGLSLEFSAANAQASSSQSLVM